MDVSHSPGPPLSLARRGAHESENIFCPRPAAEAGPLRASAAIRKMVSPSLTPIGRTHTGPQGEGLLRSMNETRAFGTFRQTQTLLTTISWGLIAAFLLTNLFAALT